MSTQKRCPLSSFKIIDLSSLFGSRCCDSQRIQWLFPQQLFISSIFIKWEISIVIVSLHFVAKFGGWQFIMSKYEILLYAIIFTECYFFTNFLRLNFFDLCYCFSSNSLPIRDRCSRTDLPLIYFQSICILYFYLSVFLVLELIGSIQLTIIFRVQFKLHSWKNTLICLITCSFVCCFILLKILKSFNSLFNYPRRLLFFYTHWHLLLVPEQIRWVRQLLDPVLCHIHINNHEKHSDFDIMLPLISVRLANQR